MTMQSNTTPLCSSPVQDYLDELHAEYSGIAEGKVANYIPELAKADPNWFGAGVIIRVRFVLVPDRDRFAFGTKTVFDELPVTTRLVAIFSTSLT